VVSECCFVPKLDSVGGAQDDAADGDRGYLLVFATCTEAERAVMGTERAEAGDGRRSRLYVLDAQKLEGEWRGDECDVIVAVLALPGAVPYGLHGCWVPYEELQPPALVVD
jgi:carotenoid cleavage dioxygenase-like enzyme